MRNLDLSFVHLNGLECFASSTTSLVSSWTEGLDLISLDKPKDKILGKSEQHLQMHGGQRAICDGGKSPRKQAEEAAALVVLGNCTPT